MPRLKQDSVRYNSAGVFSTGANTWWQCFLDTFEDDYASIPDSPPAWYLDQLKMIRASSQRVADPVPTIPETILSLYKNQTEKHNKVMLYA